MYKKIFISFLLITLTTPFCQTESQESSEEELNREVINYYVNNPRKYLNFLHQQDNNSSENRITRIRNQQFLVFWRKLLHAFRLPRWSSWFTTEEDDLKPQFPTWCLYQSPEEHNWKNVRPKPKERHDAESSCW